MAVMPLIQIRTANQRPHGKEAVACAETSSNAGADKAVWMGGGASASGMRPLKLAGLWGVQGMSILTQTRNHRAYCHLALNRSLKRALAIRMRPIKRLASRVVCPRYRNRLAAY